MGDEVTDADAATEIATEYADSECVGQPGDVVSVEERESDWVVEVRTHTYSDAYTHRIRITRSVGNVVEHDRET